MDTLTAKMNRLFARLILTLELALKQNKQLLKNSAKA